MPVDFFINPLSKDNFLEQCLVDLTEILEPPVHKQIGSLAVEEGAASEHQQKLAAAFTALKHLLKRKFSIVLSREEYVSEKCDFVVMTEDDLTHTFGFGD